MGHADFEIPTFTEEIELIQGLNKSSGKHVGIYPELKKPTFHTQAGHNIGKIVLNILASYGYHGSNAHVYVQCFEPQYLRQLRSEFGTKLPLIQLIGNGQGYDYLVTPQGLDDITTYADGIGPSINRIVQHKKGQQDS